MNNDSPTANSRIVFLDYLRIFAFVSVLIGHKFYDYVVALSNNDAVHATLRLIASLLLPFIKGGGAGVVVFFLVSGYIITHVLQTEQTCEFLIKRIFRIYPLYIVAVLTQAISLAFVGRAPSLSILVPQLLLVGDFLGTPYSLGGVEWTLRVEVVFYVFMAVLHSLSLITSHKKILPYIILAMTVLCAFIAPIPSADIWSKGYFTIYAPFLLLGSMFYLFEIRKIGSTFLLCFIGLVFYEYFMLIAAYQKIWLESHFMLLAFMVFFVFWLGRKHLAATRWVMLLSDMTYPVYLFHNWFFDYAKKGLDMLSISVLNPDVQALIILLLVCLFVAKYIEKSGIRFGRALLIKLR